MKWLTLIVIISLLNVSSIAQRSELLFHPNGKMQMSNFKVSDSLKIGLKKYFKGIIFNKLDSTFLNDTSLLYAELNPFLSRTNDSTEYYYFYNGTESKISISTVAGKLPLVKIAQTKRGELWPINGLGVSSCGSNPISYSSILVHPGILFLFKINTIDTKGNFKTLSKVRLQTSNGIITTRAFESYIDENSFYLNSADKYFWNSKSREYIINYRKKAFLEK